MPLVSIKGFKWWREANFKNTCYLGRHYSLPLCNKFALRTLAISPYAKTLLSLQWRHVSLVPASGTLGNPRGFLGTGRGWGHGSRAGQVLLLDVLIVHPFLETLVS